MVPSDIDQIHEILIRLGVATVLGAILGIDRDLHKKPAGLRVLAMVALGACGIVMASISMEHSTSDGLLRTIQGVLTGIGFLGAGVIMHAQGKDEVHGLTTAATIWISAIVGLICGTGQAMLAGSIFAVAWGLLIVGRWLERMIVSWSIAHSKKKSIDAGPARNATKEAMDP
jgi:putative Mg2+ transporter-C (MgtC) family protein